MVWNRFSQGVAPGAGPIHKGRIMESSVVEVAQAVEGFSFYALFMRADWVVKSVMGVLAFMSVWSWAIAIDKAFHLRGLHAKVVRAIRSV